jgi:hypothetical protein
MMTSNGAGMGHLTRQLAVTLAAGDAMSPTLFSLSMALPVVADHGVPGEYCPSVERKWMPSGSWHGYLRDRIVAIAREVDAQAVAFDGVAPYPGILAARNAMPDIAFVWVRRGMWRAGVNTAQLRKSPLFDRIVEPGDLAASADEGPTGDRTDAVRVPPITMLDVVPRLSRPEAAAALGLDPARPTALVTLGSGRLGEIEAPGAVVVDALLEDPTWQICVTKSTIAERAVPLRNEGRVVELRGVYPLVRYLHAFDTVVSAAGYNAVHEFIPAALPTLLVPNPATRTDDQVGRADRLAKRGLALAAHPDAPADLSGAVRLLSGEALRTELAEACAALPVPERSGGAAATAEQIVGMASSFTGRKATWRRRLATFDAHSREAAKRALGERGTDVLRRILGRSHDDVPQKLSVAIEPAAVPEGAVALAFGDDIAAERIREGGPVEHILAGASPAYWEERRRIVEEFFDVS